MERIQSREVKSNDDAKSDSGGIASYQVKLRKTGLLKRPSEDDAESPLAQKNTARYSGHQTGRSGQRSQPLIPDEGHHSAAPSPSYSRDKEPIEHTKKLTYRERRELELRKQREEEQAKEEMRQSPEKDVASLIRKRIAANKNAVSLPNSASKSEAQDRLGSLKPTTTPYSRTNSKEYSRNTPAKSTNDLEYDGQSESMDTDGSKEFSIESAGSSVLQKLESQPSAAISHLRRLQQLQSNKDNSENDSSPETRHQMLISVGSGDAEDHKKSSTPKATKMMLNAFLAGRSSIAEGGETASSPDAKAKSPSGASGLPALKNDPKFEKYFKMLKMGMPKEAVKHAMTRDGQDPDLLDQDPNKPAGIPLKDDPTYQKYFKMLRVGMPMEAVKHAMIRDGLDCSVMDQDHNLPASKMTKKDDDDDEPKEKDSRRRARLHWKTLRKVTSNSLWAKIDQEVDMEHIEIDEQEFQELFQAEQDEIKPATTSVVTPAKGVTVRVIDPKRANNGGIILARLKMSHDDMADAVDRINEHALSAEQIENIIEYLPSKEERKALEAYMLEGGQDAAEKFEGLCECEKFMVSMMTVKHAKRKVRALLFKLQFEKCLDDILKDTLAIEAACDNLTHSVRLRQLLGIILNFGNRLNTAGNKKRKAGAFTLDSLLKLNQAKAFDRKTTFLNYIVLIVQRNNEILLNFKDDLPAVFKADKVFWDQCLSDLEEVESQLENVRKIALYQAKQAHYRFRRKKRQDDDGDESLGDDDMNLSLEEEVEALRSTPIGMFTLMAIKYVSSLRDKVEETKAKFSHLLEYFGEEEKGPQPHELFATIVNFCRDFDKAKEEVFALEKRKQREERKRQAGRPPTHSPAPQNEKTRQPMLLKASSHQPNFSDAMKGSSAVRNQSEYLYSGQRVDQYHHSQNSEHRPASQHSYERSNSDPQRTESNHTAYTRTNSIPDQQNTYEPDRYVPRDPYSPGSAPTATSAAARLKAKARIQRRTSPIPSEEQNASAYHEAQTRAAHYEVQAHAAAQANAAGHGHVDNRQQYSAQNQYSAPPAPPSPANNELAYQSEYASRSSFRHKRRMQVRERIRQASSREY